MKGEILSMTKTNILKDLNYTTGKLVYMEESGSLGLLTQNHSVKKLSQCDYLEILHNETWIPAYIECNCYEDSLICIYENNCYEVPMADIDIRIIPHSENEELPF